MARVKAVNNQSLKKRTAKTPAKPAANDAARPADDFQRRAWKRGTQEMAAATVASADDVPKPADDDASQRRSCKREPFVDVADYAEINADFWARGDLLFGERSEVQAQKVVVVTRDAEVQTRQWAFLKSEIENELARELLARAGVPRRWYA